MKVGVVKLGGRVSYSSQGSNGGCGEAVSIIEMLDKGGADVVVFTKILDKDKNPDYIEFRNIEDSFNQTADLDCLLVINGNVSFYGGQEDVPQILNYVMINAFKGSVFYTYCDPALSLKQIWSSVEKKPWANHWTQDQLDVTRKDIIYLSQPYDVDAALKHMGKNTVKPGKIIHFPFEQFPCLHDRLPFNPNPPIDLSYGGTMRGGRRIKKMMKFYFNHPSNLNVHMFGKITSDDFPETTARSPVFTGPVKYDQMLNKMNDSTCHIVLGDPLYEKINDIPQRLYESVWAGVVTFVDADMDTVRRVWKNDSALSEFLYVSSREELTEKIQLLKDSPDIRKKIVEQQVAAIGFDAVKYCKSFTSLIQSEKI